MPSLCRLAYSINALEIIPKLSEGMELGMMRIPECFHSFSKNLLVRTTKWRPLYVTRHLSRVAAYTSCSSSDTLVPPLPASWALTASILFCLNVSAILGLISSSMKNFNLCTCPQVRIVFSQIVLIHHFIKFYLS